MSLAFFGRFEGIGWGTLVISLDKRYDNRLFSAALFDKYFDFTPLFKNFAAHFELGQKTLTYFPAGEFSSQKV